MVTSATAAVRERLRHDIDTLAQADRTRDRSARPAPPAASGMLEARPAAERLPEGAEPFGRWLIAQHDRGDWIDDLAAAARRDPAFPKAGSPRQVADRLRALGADGDVFEQLEDAERCWRTQ